MAVKLIKTNKYLTYQLYAVMSNKNTKLDDGLKLAALVCLKWLRNRLEEYHIPDELYIGEIEEYKKLNNDCFKSFVINDSFTIEVISNIDLGIWSLRIVENDLGALDKENMVPGRVIQSDIAFRIVDNELECGFRTTVSDTQKVNKANCIRFGVVKELAQNPDFGLSQIVDLYYPINMEIKENNLFDIKNIIRSKSNQLPFILYTFDDHSIANVDEIKNIKITSVIDTKLMKAKVEPRKEENPLDKTLAYANRYLGKARPYFLPKRLFKEFSDYLNVDNIKHDEVLLIEPRMSSIKRYDYSEKDKYINYIDNFTRDKEINFDDVLFIEEARLLEEQYDEEIKRKNEQDLRDALEKLTQIKLRQDREIRKAEYSSFDNTSDEELENVISQLEKANDKIELLDKEKNRLVKENKDKTDRIKYYERKEKRPNKHEEIVDWSSQFDSIIFNSKAVKCLENNDATTVEIDKICDAIDYLGTIYYDYLFNVLDEDELNRKSSLIYNRPFNVSPSGIDKSARGNCKIKYTFEGKKNAEYVLDQHLKIGNGSDLLRIYFIIDKERKKIVIGSLPNHLVY